MVRSIARLREASDEDLIREHDKLAGSTLGGTDYYVAELHRRELERAEKSNRRLARISAVAAWISAAAAVAATILSVLVAFK